MFLAPKTVKGHRYYYVLSSRRRDNRPQNEVHLYLGRLEGIDPRTLEEKRRAVRGLGHPALALQFDALLVQLGHPVPLPSLRDLDLATVRSYGPELTLVRLAEELRLVELIGAESPKGGGPPLGKMTLALAIYANLHPGSLWRFVEWYRRSPLSLFLDRKNHVMDIAEDRALAWFVGLNARPKVTTLSAYSYWCGPRPHRSLLQALVRHRDREKGYPSLSFNLDFHTIRHYGDPGVSRLEKNYVPRRSQSVPSVLVAYAQEEGSQELVYARANLLKREKADEVVRFLEFWEGSTGKTPEELVFDSKMTTEAGLAQLVEKKVTLLTLRDRRPDEVKRVLALPDSSWTTVELDLPHREYRHPRVWEETVKLAGVPRRLRQIVARDMGKELPMFLLTNDRKRAAATLLSRYPLRTHIENSIQEQVGMFHVDALGSSVRLKVEMDVVLDVLASAAYRWMAHQLRGLEKAEAITIWERFLNRGGHVRLEKDEVVLEVEPFSRAPVLLESPLLQPSTPIPWLGDRRAESNYDARRTLTALRSEKIKVRGAHGVGDTMLIRTRSVSGVVDRGKNKVNQIPLGSGDI